MTVDWLGAAVSKYGAIVGGLLIGTAAKYGLALTEGKRLTLKGALADLLLLGILGLIALLVSDSLALTGNARVLAGALAAVSSDRLVRLARDRFIRTADAQIADLMPPSEREAIMRVPAGSGEPASVGVQKPPSSPASRIGAALKQDFPAPRGAPADQIDLLRQLD